LISGTEFSDARIRISTGVVVSSGFTGTWPVGLLGRFVGGINDAGATLQIHPLTDGQFRLGVSDAGDLWIVRFFDGSSNGAGSGLLETDTFGGTLTLEASQTLGTPVINSSEGIVVIGNGVAPPPPVGDASSQGAQPVPEPSAAALLALSAAALLTRGVRNRK
jgi:hypothetical protein